VAHARIVRLIGESRRKDDRLDAQANGYIAPISGGPPATIEIANSRESEWNRRFIAPF